MVLEPDENKRKSWNDAKPDPASHAGAEQIDWNSFVNLEYDPTILDPTIAASLDQEPSVINQDNTQILSNNTEDTCDGEITCTPQELSSFATMEFPSMDEWWAELPENREQEQFDTWTTSQGNTPNSDSNSNSSAFFDWQSPGEDGESARKRRKRLPPDARRLLAESFENHKENPYIPKEELQSLAEATGLTSRQVQTYFANARARKLPRAVPGNNAIDIPGVAEQQDPMERFLSSSPEDEGISEDAVRAAADQTNRPIKPIRSRKGKASSVRSSSQSSTSASSNASMDSLDSRGSRKGRKRQREPARSGAKSIFRKPSSPSRKHQCTFCTHDFEQKYDWKRHEESVHFPQKEWVCMPNGPLEDSRCVFCGLEGADEEHLTSHKSRPCSNTPRAQRTFQRKDKLVQHIKQVHGCGPPKMIKAWCRPIERNVLLLCGFCSLELPDWKARADHLSLHFTNDINMTMWLPELIGGIWPADDMTTTFVRDRFSATQTPTGNVTCESCPARFTNLRQLTLHRRQAHNLFRATDSRVVMSKPTAGHHSQRLINLAQQTSRIQITRTNGDAGDAAATPQGPADALPDYSAMFSRMGSAKPMPMGMKASVDRRMEQPETRGFASTPHVAWTKVVNVAGVAPARPAVRNPLVGQPAMPARRAAFAPSSLRRSGLGENAVAHAEGVVERAGGAATSEGDGSGPPVGAVRAVLTSSREGVGGVNRPVQGMLHSLEQFGAESARALWPRPPGLPDG